MPVLRKRSYGNGPAALRLPVLRDGHHPEDAQQDGCRKPVPEEDVYLLESWAEKQTSELMTYTTARLIYLLRYARKQRASSYNLVRVFKKAGNAAAAFTTDYEDVIQATGESYEYWTRKAWVMENILRERSGDFPAKITDKFLVEYRERIKAVNAKPMAISKSRRKS